MLRAALFDFNGIVVDDEVIHYELLRQVLAEEDIALSREEYFRIYLAFDDRRCFQEAMRRAGRELPESLLARLITRKATYYRERIARDGYDFFPGAIELIDEAAAAGWMMGIVSGALHEEVDVALRQAGVRDCFKSIIAAEDVTESKPDPEGYRRGIEALNRVPPLPERLLHPHEILAIEDSPAGLQAAARAGLSTLAVANTYPLDQLQEADRAVPTLEGLDLPAILDLF